MKDDVSAPGMDRIYVLGGRLARTGPSALLPALAPLATQQGLHLGQALSRLDPATVRAGRLILAPFSYASRGDAAVVGRSSALFVIGRWALRRSLAWLFWGLVHVYLLIGFDRRLSVATQWLWRYLTTEGGTDRLNALRPAVQCDC